MFSSKEQPSKELYDTLQSTELTQKYIEKNGFDLKNLEISKARIQGVKAKHFSLSNIKLNNYDSRNSILVDGLFENVEFYDAYFNESEITNVTFRNSNLKKVNFFGVDFSNTKFIDCEISKSTFFELKDSDIEFINTKIYDNEYKFSDSQIQMRLINSEFRDTDMMSLKEGSSIYMENSEINNVNFQYSKLKFFKSVNSKMLKSTLGDSNIGELSFINSLIDISFGDAIIDKVSVTESTINKLGAIWVTVKDFEISNCENEARVSFAESKIDSIRVTNCNFSKIAPAELTTKSLLIENSVINKSSFYKSNIENFILRNVTFTGETDFLKFTAQNATLENIKKGPDIELILDEANIDF